MIDAIVELVLDHDWDIPIDAKHGFRARCRIDDIRAEVWSGSACTVFSALGLIVSGISILHGSVAVTDTTRKEEERG